MKQFTIFIHSFADIHRFVSLSSQQTFDVALGENQEINGKSLMAVLGMNFNRPILVSVQCDEESFCQYRAALAQFLV